MSGVSSSGLLITPSCLGTAGTNAKTEFKGATLDSSSVATTAVVGACSSPGAETILSGKLLQSEDVKYQFRQNDLVTHLVPALVVAMSLSELGSTSIDNGMGARDKRRRDDNFPGKDPAILRMDLFLDDLSVDMMIVKDKT